MEEQKKDRKQNSITVADPGFLIAGAVTPYLAKFSEKSHEVGKKIMEDVPVIPFPWHKDVTVRSSLPLLWKVPNLEALGS